MEYPEVSWCGMVGALAQVFTVGCPAQAQVIFVVTD